MPQSRRVFGEVRNLHACFECLVDAVRVRWNVQAWRVIPFS
jgi:hypothetical protein